MVTGIKIGSIIGGVITGASDAKTKRPPDLEVGGEKVPVWLEARGDQVQATIGPFGTSVTIGPGASISDMTSSVNGQTLRVATEDTLLVVNGHAYEVSVEAGKAKAAPTSRKPSGDGVGFAGGARPAAGVVITGLDLSDMHVLGNVTSTLDQLGAKGAAPPKTSALGDQLKAMSWDDERSEALRDHTGRVAAADVPGVLAAFDWDKGRFDALAALVGKVDGAVPRDAALATFDWDKNKATASADLAALG